MKKICIFCGEKPESKNREHIIPIWLIEMTGDPKREINLGIDINKPDSPQRKFAFDQFVFPACEECNSFFGRIESRVKPIVEGMLSLESISVYDLSFLLDWMDKVRVGLWLGMYYLDKNVAYIQPRFHIFKRNRLTDRMVAIYRVEDSFEGISFLGVSTPAFQYSPTCFVLALNNLLFFNLSTHFLCSRRLGFPYPEEQSYDPQTGGIAVNLNQGLERIMYPILRKSILGNGKKFFQPIFSNAEFSEELIETFYNNAYVKSNSLSWENGIGKIFLEANGKVSIYPEIPSKSWIPKARLGRFELVQKLSNQMLDYQIHMMEYLPIVEKLKPGHKKIIKEQFNYARSFKNICKQEVKKRFKY